MDITMCTAKLCEYKGTCLRHDEQLADKRYQSWCDFSFECNVDSGFDMYIKNVKY